MAKITGKNITKLTDWNLKELRKLKIMINNRVEKLKLSPKDNLDTKHLLYGKGIGELDELLISIRRAEKEL